jgi:DNA-binding transcriptional LysR family regulator
MSRAMVTRYVAELEQWLASTPVAAHHPQRDADRCGRELALRRMPANARADGERGRRSHHQPPADANLRGQLRITCSMSFAYAQLAAAVVDFWKLHPQLKIDLNASEGALNLVEARIDLAIRISAEPDPMLIGRALAPCTSVLVASPAYLAAARCAAQSRSTWPRTVA